MKTKVALLCVLLVIGLVASACASQAPTVTPGATPSPPVSGGLAITVTCGEFGAQSQMAAGVRMAVGDSVTVTLCSNPTTGYVWTDPAQVANSTVVLQTSHAFQEPPSGLMGASGNEIWTFKALKSGQTTVSMAYGQPWLGGEQGVRTFTLTVAVAQPLAVTVTCDQFAALGNITEGVNVVAGDTFTVTLCSNPTTGFSWVEGAQIADPTVLQQVSHEFVAPAGGLAGEPTKDVWTFKALKTGQTTASMAYSQSEVGETHVAWNFILTATAN